MSARPDWLPDDWDWLDFPRAVHLWCEFCGYPWAKKAAQRRDDPSDSHVWCDDCENGARAAICTTTLEAS